MEDGDEASESVKCSSLKPEAMNHKKIDINDDLERQSIHDFMAPKSPIKTCSLQILGLPAANPAYPLTCSKPFL